MATGWQHAHAPRRQSLPPDWSARRARQLRLDQHRCQLRGPRCTGLATEVDHIGDRDDHERLRSVCSPCHATRTGIQGGSASGSARRSRAALRTRPIEPHPSERAQK